MATPIYWPNTGELNRRIRIYAWQDVPRDAAFGLTQNLDDAYTCWAKVEPVNGVAYWLGKQIENEVTHLFWIRLTSQTSPENLTAEHVIEWQNRRYRVMRTHSFADNRKFTVIEAKDLGDIGNTRDDSATGIVGLSILNDTQQVNL